MSRELDAKVAEKVMGWTFQMDRELGPIGWCDHNGVLIGDCPAYSTDPGAAWLVVERMEALGWWTYIKKPAPSMGDDTYWQVRFYSKHNPMLHVGTGVDQSMPLAVCKAALSALGVEVSP